MRSIRRIGKPHLHLHGLHHGGHGGGNAFGLGLNSNHMQHVRGLKLPSGLDGGHGPELQRLASLRVQAGFPVFNQQVPRPLQFEFDAAPALIDKARLLAVLLIVALAIPSIFERKDTDRGGKRMVARGPRQYLRGWAVVNRVL